MLNRALMILLFPTAPGRLGRGAQVADGPAQAPGNLGAKFNALVGYAKYLGFSICVLALIGAAVTMALQHRRGGSTEHVGGIVKVLVAVSVIAAASSLVTLFIS